MFRKVLSLREFRRDIVDTGSCSFGLSLFDGFLDHRVDDQMRSGNPDVLLKMKQGQLELREFLLGHRNP